MIVYNVTITAVRTYDQVIVRTATRSTLKVAANLTQILNFQANFHKKFELFCNFQKNNFMLTISLSHDFAILV